jgi:transcriptional regulator with PAS, ATPase and Fis domain
MIQRVAETDADVLILGENGTGKELVARDIHRKSDRNDQVFITVDLGAVPETLFESELFGHVKGAYTDACQDKPGRFELATGGTIFLDEIGNLSLPMQSKLLSVLENRKIVRIGSHIEIPVDVRLVSATNRNLKQMVNERRFREDLLYRINTVEIHIPPLRERKNDIPMLVDHFLEIYRRKYHKSKLGISQQTLRKIMNYPWPGNIRELKNAVERAVILGTSGQLSSANLFPTSFSVPVPGLQNSFNLEENEKQLIMKAINHNRGNMTRAARDLGIARAALYRRMKKFGL